MRVSVVDYDIGNVQSVVNACSNAGAETLVVSNGRESLIADNAMLTNSYFTDNPSR